MKRSRTIYRTLESLERRVMLIAGDVDTTFGNNGAAGGPIDRLNATQVVTRADGDIYALGQNSLVPDDLSLSILRIDPDGTPDQNFNTGVPVIFNRPGDDIPISMALAPDGGVIVLALNAQNTSPYVIHVLPFGSIDPNFGDGGFTFFAPDAFSATSMEVDPQGNIYVGGGTNDLDFGVRPAIIKLFPDSSLDVMYGTGGVALGQVSGVFVFNDIALDPDGNRILAIGGQGGPAGFQRFTPFGTIDMSLNATGQVFLTQFSNRADGIALQGGGRIIVNGASGSATPTRSLMRFLSSGLNDPGFGDRGVLVTTDPAPTLPVDNSGGLLVDSNDKFYLVASNGQVTTVTRYLPDGALDMAYGAGGRAQIPAALSPVFAFDAALGPAGAVFIAGANPNNGSITKLFGDDAPTMPFASVKDGILQVLGTPQNDLITVFTEPPGGVAGAGGIRASLGTISMLFPLGAIISVRVDSGLGNDTIQLTMLTSRASVLGGSGDDRVFGGTMTDTIRGGEGADILMGNSGGDRIFGGPDNDVLMGGGGNDGMLDGEIGNDQIMGGGGNDMLMGGTGNDELSGSPGNDTLDMGAGADRGFGGTGDDMIMGGMNIDTLDGQDGADTLSGGDSHDLLLSDDGIANDILRGDGGIDIVRTDSGDTIQTCELRYRIFND